MDMIRSDNFAIAENFKTQSLLRLFLFLVFVVVGCLRLDAARKMENLDRGVVAISLGEEGVYLGWRRLGTDPETVSFNIYRNDRLINAVPVVDSTNFLDAEGTIESVYQISVLIDAVEIKRTETTPVWEQQYLEIPVSNPGLQSETVVESESPQPASDTANEARVIYSPNDASVGDLDGDGQYEIVLKWDPANSQDNSRSGVTDNVYLDAYELDGTLLWRIDLGVNIRAGAHYTQFIVYDLDSDGYAEVACRTSDGTIDGAGNVIGDSEADYRNADGYILTGNEYLTIFEGATGTALVTEDFFPNRGGSVREWGDNYGNRCDRFLAGVAYLDGERPSLILGRGYYKPKNGYSARNEIVAYNWREEVLPDELEVVEQETEDQESIELQKVLSQVWYFKSNTSGLNESYLGQGCHSLSINDVDGDGYDEIVYGSCTIDDDGTGLYSTELGHGDALHVSDFDPLREGLELWQCHEEDPYGATFRDAATGEIIFRYDASKDTGRACAGDILADSLGAEVWASGGVPLSTISGINMGAHKNPINFMVWWDGDLLREFLDRNRITKYNVAEPLLEAVDCDSNNGSKATPCLSADILGDWREEVIWRTEDNTAIRIYSTTALTSYRLYTLMHDPQYRQSIAWQNTGYNQPPHTSFHLGHVMISAPIPDIELVVVEEEVGEDAISE